LLGCYMCLVAVPAVSGGRVKELDAFYVLSEPQHLERLLALLRGNWRAFAQAGHPIMVHLMPEHARRSLDQNRALWRLLSMIAESAWVQGKQFDKNAWAEFFKRQFLPLIEGPDGEYYPTSTSSLNVGQFSHFLDQIEAYAASELGLELA